MENTSFKIVLGAPSILVDNLNEKGLGPSAETRSSKTKKMRAPKIKTEALKPERHNSYVIIGGVETGSMYVQYVTYVVFRLPILLLLA